MPTKLALADKLPLFTTVTLGVCKNAAAYRKAFDDAQWPAGRPDSLTTKALDNISIAQQEVEIDLVGLTPKDMGFEFPSGASCVGHDKLWAFGAGLGLQLCPHEAAYATLLKWDDELTGKIGSGFRFKRDLYFASDYIRGCLLGSSYTWGSQDLHFSMNHYQYQDDLVIFMRNLRPIGTKRDWLSVAS